MKNCGLPKGYEDQCCLNHCGMCTLDTAEFKEIDRATEMRGCGFIGVNDRYLMWKYGVPYKDFNCGHCQFYKGETHGECTNPEVERHTKGIKENGVTVYTDSKEYYSGAHACKLFRKQEEILVDMNTSIRAPHCPYLSSMGVKDIQCALHARFRDKREFESAGDQKKYVDSICYKDFDCCETYKTTYAEEMASTDKNILEYRECAFCCNNSGYTGLNGQNGSTHGFCQVRQEAVPKFDTGSVCEWFNRLKREEVREVAKKKQTPEDLLKIRIAELTREFADWDHIKVEGCNDPFWPDGSNMNLVHNHIIYHKNEIEKICTENGLDLPEIYYKETPPEVDQHYMARGYLDEHEKPVREYLMEGDHLPKQTYYTKCDREFQKNSTAVVTGYDIDINDPECADCPFQVDVKEGWPQVHKKWECRAGSQPPNHKTEWTGSLENKNTISIHSLDNQLMEKIKEFCEAHPDLGAGYNADHMADCRRTLSINCSSNKKGIAAKRELIEKFFPEDKEEISLTSDEGLYYCEKEDCPFNDRECGCCFGQEDHDDDFAKDLISAIKDFDCGNENVQFAYKLIRPETHIEEDGEDLTCETEKSQTNAGSGSCVSGTAETGAISTVDKPTATTAEGSEEEKADSCCCENCIHSEDWGESVEYIKCAESGKRKDVKKKQAVCANYVPADVSDSELDGDLEEQLEELLKEGVQEEQIYIYRGLV